MSTIMRFEDIKTWQKARKLVSLVYKSTKTGGLARDFALRDQLRRASVSIMTNIAEGFARKSNKEFANFLNFSIGSAVEVQSLLYVAFDLGYLTQNQFDLLFSESVEITRMAKTFAKYLRSTTAKSKKSNHGSTAPRNFGTAADSKNQ